ncbi:MAG: phenylalanine--tRNA ligase beta subunit-related protein [Cyclobacteriaceae bacterium]|nr:phenylalanine--tRNA ligase beta subunit-related protein [Cyclobacteriaceae bacterium]
MNNLKISDALIKKIPLLRLCCISCEVQIGPSGVPIKKLSNEIIAKIQQELTIETVSQKPTIRATKEAYRILGKDPSRYRPSAEALTRRVVSGKGIYEINNIVDILNLVSLDTGFSIGGYDADKIVGDVEFGVGLANEPYEAIGRGELNIENLPLFRDELGAFGSPTSDSLRTMVTENTTRFLMVIIDFDGSVLLDEAMQKSIDWLSRLGKAQNIHAVESECVNPVDNTANKRTIQMMKYTQ